MSNNELRVRLHEARVKYRPDLIKTIIVAEAPPDTLDRFFYYHDVKTHDHLFLNVMEVLYPHEKQLYLNSGRLAEVKKGLLERFRDDGYYLMDLSELPLSFHSGALKDEVPSLIVRLKAVGALNRSIPIILVKATVYETAYHTLRREGFNMVNTGKIAFPSSGQQVNFKQEFIQIIHRLRKES